MEVSTCNEPSVVCADRTTATRKVNSLTEFRGTGGSGYSLFSVCRMACDLSRTDDDAMVLSAATGFSDRLERWGGRRVRLRVRSSSDRQSIAGRRRQPPRGVMERHKRAPSGQSDAGSVLLRSEVGLASSVIDLESVRDWQYRRRQAMLLKSIA